eukprot:scaffold244230_cov31-Tisochrysis_lutea.AAC.3
MPRDAWQITPAARNSRNPAHMPVSPIASATSSTQLAEAPFRLLELSLGSCMRSPRRGHAISFMRPKRSRLSESEVRAPSAV